MDCNSPPDHSKYPTGSYRSERRPSRRVVDEEMVLLSEIGPMLTWNVGQIATTSRIASLTTNGCFGVVLESVRVGERNFTSIDALDRFANRLVMQARDDWPGVLRRELGLD